MKQGLTKQQDSPFSLPLRAIGIGSLIGVVAGAAGSQLLRICHARRWITGAWLQVPVIAANAVLFRGHRTFAGKRIYRLFCGWIGVWSDFEALQTRLYGRDRSNRRLDGASDVVCGRVGIDWFELGIRGLEMLSSTRYSA